MMISNTNVVSTIIALYALPVLSTKPTFHFLYVLLSRSHLHNKNPSGAWNYGIGIHRIYDLQRFFATKETANFASCYL